jgi:hypothetical protein
MNNKINNIIIKIRRKEIVQKTKDSEYDFSTGSFEDFIEFDKISFGEKLKNLFSFPVLVLHELLHIIIALIVFVKIKDFHITSFKMKNFHATVELESFENKYKNFFIALAPFLALISMIILSFINSYFLIGLVYLLLNLKMTLPSKLDIQNILLFKYKNEFDNDIDYIIFISECYDKLSLIDMIK